MFIIILVTTLAATAIASVAIVLFRSRKIPGTIGFFHPYCAAGGGGERVLWCAIRALHKHYPRYKIYVYTGDTNILEKVSQTFGIQFERPIEFVHLRYRWLLDPERYPFLTLLFQSLGSFFLSIEAANRFLPEIYIDSMGFAWTLPVFRVLGSSTVSYVHYPFISTDMIESVSLSHHESFNNRHIIATSSTLKRGKLIYYKLFAWIYGYFGRLSQVVMVNSTWTKNHIERLWLVPTCIVYPPCNVESFKSLSLDRFNNRDTSNIISVAQFRPEKNHSLQLKAFKTYQNRMKSSSNGTNSKLYLYGGCRDYKDRRRVDFLKKLACDLYIEQQVIFAVGAPFDELLKGIEKADIAIHSMMNEHFGIVLVECMAAGLIVVAHKSGGPKDDIIDHGVNGFLASDVEDFASLLVEIENLPDEEKMSIRKQARKRADDFSDSSFESGFLKALETLLKFQK